MFEFRKYQNSNEKMGKYSTMCVEYLYHKRGREGVGERETDRLRERLWW